MHSNGIFSFAEEVLEFNASHFMASFNINSLFTNIHLTKMYNFCIQSIYQYQTHVTNLTESSIYNLCLNHFLYLVYIFYILNNAMT